MNENWIKCVLCGDSRDILKRIPDNSIDFILTDPPYNIGKHSTGNIPLPGRSAMNNDVAQWYTETNRKFIYLYFVQSIRQMVQLPRP